MRKIFFLIPALILAMMVNAETKTIGPNDPNVSVNDVLIAALQNAADNDVIILTDGIYNEYSNNIDFNKNVEVKAADGAKPVVNVGCYIKVQGGKHVTVKGIKFDGTEQGHNGNSYSYFIRVYDNAANTLELEDCEFCNTDDRVILVESNKHLDLLKINNCYFHDVTNSAIHIEESSSAHACNRVEIKNSTFANFSGFGDKGLIQVYSKNHSIADNPNDDQELVVDHCTFYNITKTSDDTYSIIDSRKTSKAEISNCIFVNPATLPDGAYNLKASQLYGGSISNCLIYHVLNHRTEAVTPTGALKDVNPLFVDAEHADYSLRMGSPARGAATDASSLGDPRWAGNLVIESAISTDLVLEPADAARNEYFKLDANLHLKANNPDPATENYGIATWQVHVTREVAAQVKLHINASSLYGHTYKVEIINASTEEKIGEVAENGWQNVTGEVAFSNIINLSEGTYTVKLSNTCNGSTEAILDDVTLAYAGGNAVNIPGDLAISDAIHNGEIKDGAIKFADALTGWAKWNIVVADEAFYDVNITIKNQWEHNLTATIYEEDGVTEVGTATVGNKSTSSTEGHSFRMGGVYLMPGNYVLKVTNAREGSDAKIVGLNLATAGGAVQAVPGATSNSEAWYSNNGTRAEGKISFSTYNGAWVKWNMTAVSTGTYNIKLRVDNPTAVAHKFAIHITKAGEAEGDPIFTETWNETYKADAPLEIECGSFFFEAGAKYVLKVTSGENGTKAKIINVVTSYAGGGTIDLSKDPVTLLPQDAILSDNATIDNDSINFGGHSSAYAKWNVHSDGGYYTFTTNTFNGYAGLGVQCTINIYNAADEENPISTKQSTWKSAYGADSFTSDAVEMPEGNYIVKIQNISDSKGRVMNIVANYEGGEVVSIPNAAIPFEEAILHGATRDNNGIHFGAVDRYAEWNIAAASGLYTFTFDVAGTDHGKYNLTIIDSQDNTVYDNYIGIDNAGSVDHANILLDAGNYTIKVANINSGSVGYITHIAATAATDVFILDENTEDDGSIAAAAATSDQYTFLLKRSFTAGKYYTICLPVGSWDDELKLAFGADYELWKMSSATQSGDEIALNFEQCNTEPFYAGWPYLIKPSVDVENPILYNKKTIQNSIYNNVQSFTAADFIGMFYKGVIPAGEKNLYLQNNNLYYNENNDTPIKGTRAWVQLKTSNNVMARIVLGGQTATEISLVNGELVNGTVKTIENGQLVIIRDGKKYNVMGIKLQ